MRRCADDGEEQRTSDTKSASGGSTRGKKVKIGKKGVNMDNVIIYQRIESLDDRERALFAFSMAERFCIGLRYYHFSTSCF